MLKFPYSNSVGGHCTQETTEQQENEKEQTGMDAQETVAGTKKT
jgi:hypothetical protein